MTRRNLLKTMGAGFATVGLSELLRADTAAATAATPITASATIAAAAPPNPGTSVSASVTSIRSSDPAANERHEHSQSVDRGQLLAGFAGAGAVAHRHLVDTRAVPE